MAPKPKDEDKKEKKEKKDKKEDKEDKDKKEKKEKKEKKDKPDGGGFSLWDSAAPEQAMPTFGAVKAPQDKRDKEREREKQEKKDGPSLMKASDLIQATINKKQEQKKEAKKEEEAKRAKANREARRAQEAKDEEGEEFQIMDKSGLGNFMDKREVMEVMKNTISEASSSSGTRCQLSTRTLMGDKVFMNKGTTFQSLGDFKTVKGFIFVRGNNEELGCNLRLTRPATLYACLSAPANSDDPYLGSWEVLPDDAMALPEFDGGAAEVVEVRRKRCKDPQSRTVSVPKPPAGLETCLVFVVPDFHSDPFPEEEETEEETLARRRREAADKRAAKSGVSSSADKEQEPSLEEKIEAVLEKVRKGEKLSNKEKRLHEKHLEKNPEYKNDDDEAPGSMKAFTISLEGGKNDPPVSADSFSCNNFTLSAPGQTLFDNASITIVQGKRYGILGPNGMGKTTILRHIASRDLPVPLNWDVILVEQEAKASNRSAVDEVLAADHKTMELLQREDQLLKQLEEVEEAMAEGRSNEVSPEELEKTRAELEQVAAELEASGSESAEAKVRKILCGLGFTNGSPDSDRFSMDRPVVQFSGGWRMRISLAKALFLQPKLLMLDEPTNHLDLDAVLWLDNYLSDVYPHAVVVVSHDADFLDSVCTDILHLEARKLVHYRGDYTAFKKMHNVKKRELDKEYKKQQDELKALKRKGKTREEAEELIKKKFGIDLHDNLMEKQKDYIVKFNFIGHGMDRSLGLNVSEVAFSYDGKEPWLLEGCEMGVDCGSRIAIVGPNGAGKSTLLNLMMQQLEPCLGEVSVSKGIRVRQYHQHFEELLPLDKTGVEYLQSAFDLSPPERARAVLGQFGLPGTSHFTKIGNLSGGQKARVAFAALMLSKPHIIILDEPTNHLDIESVEALTDAVSKFNGGLVLVTHDARLITEVDCELWVVEDGGCYRFEKGFEGYRDKVLDQLREREEEVERMGQQRREARAAKRAKHVDEERLKAAKKKLAEQEETQVPVAMKHADPTPQSAAQTANGDASKHADVEEVADATQMLSSVEGEQAGRDQSAKAEFELESGGEAAASTLAPEAPSAETKEEVDEISKGQIEQEKEVLSDADEECVDVDAVHDEYLIGEVVSLRSMKQKKGFFLCEVDVGRDEYVPIVTNRKHVQKGNKIIIAVEGATVGGEEVIGEHVHSEWSAGVVCSPVDMGWEGDAHECITLHGACEVGNFAPSSSKTPLLIRPSSVDGVDSHNAEEATDSGRAKVGDETIDNEEDDGERGASTAKAKAKGKPKKGKSKQEDNDNEEHDEDMHATTKSKGKAKAKAQTKKAKGRRGGEDDEEDDDDDDNVVVAKGKDKVRTKVQNKKGRTKRDDDSEEEDEEQETLTAKAKAKAKAKTQGKKGKGKRDDGDEEEEEDLHASAARGRRGRGKQDEESDDDMIPAAKAKPQKGVVKRDDGCEEDSDADVLERGAGDIERDHPEAPSGMDGAKHSEFKVAQVVSVDAMKKKKGFFLVELQLGGEAVSVVTSFPNVEAGQRVILAPEGSTVSGKEVKRQKVAGEWTAGVICGPMELGWPGDASCCVLLDETHEVGDFAPAGPGGNLASASAAGARHEETEPRGEGEEDEQDESKRDEAGDDEDDKGGKRKGGEPQATKAKGRKSKAKEEADDAAKGGEFSDDDDDGRRGKKKGKRK